MTAVTAILHKLTRMGRLARLWLRDQTIYPWQAFEAAGGGVMVGEWGSHHMIPSSAAMMWRASRDLKQSRRSSEIFPSMPNIDELGIAATIARRNRHPPIRLPPSA